MRVNSGRGRRRSWCRVRGRRQKENMTMDADDSDPLVMGSVEEGGGRRRRRMCIATGWPRLGKGQRSGQSAGVVRTARHSVDGT